MTASLPIDSRMFSVVALVALLTSPCASALMSKVSGSSLSAAAAGADPVGTTMEGVQGLSRLSSLYDAFLIGKYKCVRKRTR